MISNATILRDTGASQSLLLEGVLHLSENTSVGATVLLQGVELCCFNVPLHRIYLKSDLAQHIPYQSKTCLINQKDHLRIMSGFFFFSMALVTTHT
jgi:hypothetical protein